MSGDQGGILIGPLVVEILSSNKSCNRNKPGQHYGQELHLIEGKPVPYRL